MIMNESTDDIRWIERIETDVLGEIYCAEAQVRGSKEVVLVRLFDRQGVAPEEFLKRVAARRPWVGNRISDQLLTSHRLGVIEGRAFELTTYLSGTSLNTLIRKARQHREVFPLEVALFVAAKIANGLRAGYEASLDGNHIVHGFVTPHLVRVSEEGVVAVGGLETVPALRTFRGTAAAFSELFPYLSPEARTSEEPHVSDDVYSLGAILFELLTLKPLASPADLRIDSTIPAELRYFLNRSVASRFRRIQSVGQWLQELKALVVTAGWVASSTDLSAFIARVDHRLHPVRPDTSEFTAIDRKIFAQALKQQQASNDDTARSPEMEQAEVTAEQPNLIDELDRATDYQTAAVARDLLSPLVDDSKLAPNA